MKLLFYRLGNMLISRWRSASGTAEQNQTVNVFL